MANGEYKTLLDALFDGTGRAVQKLTRSSALPSYWYSSLVLVFITLLLGFLTSLFLGEQSYLRYRMIPFELLLVAVTFLSLPFVKMYIAIIYTNLQNYILDAMEEESDIVDLRQWLTALCNRKTPLLLGLFWTILNSPFLIFLLTLSGSTP